MARFVLDKDKEKIAELTAEEVKTQEEAKEKTKQLDKQIVQVWQSTRVSIPFLQHYHEAMRMRYEWYYKWHLWPYSRVAHVFILSTYLVAMTLFGAHFLSTPQRVLAATTACTWNNGNSTGIWNDAANWSCGAVPDSTKDVIFNGSVSNANITIDVAATAGSFTVNGATGGDAGVAGQATAGNTGNHLNFSTNGANVAVSGAGVFSGYGWSEDLGWIAFGTADNADGPVSENTSTGAVTGKAKILNDGSLIDFNASPYNSNVSVNTGTGAFSGYAWSTSLGWINFTGVSLSSPAYTGTITVNSPNSLSTTIADTGTGDFTMGGGSITGTGNVTVVGNVAGSAGVINMTGGTFTQNVATDKNFGTTTGSTAWTFYNLSIGVTSTTASTITTSTGGTGDITVNSVLNVGGPCITFNAGNRTYHLMGTGTPFTHSGYLTANTSTFSYENTTSASITNAPYYNLQTSPASGTPTYTLKNASTSFLAGTKVKTENGTKNIEDFKIGDKVLSYDINTNQPVMSEVTETIKGTKDAYYIINGKVKATGNHVFILSDNSQKQVDELKIGDTLKTYSGLEAVRTIEKVNQTVPVYDIEVKDYHLFYAENYLVHNFGGGGCTNPNYLTVYIANDFTLTGAGSATVNADTYDPIITLDGNFSIGSGQTFIASSTFNFNAYGNWTNAGTFTANSGTISFAKASGTQTLNSGGTASANTFNNVTHSGAGTLQLLTNNINIDGNFTNSAGTFDTNSLDMTVGGNVDLTTGSYTQGTTTMTLDGSATQLFTAGGTGAGHTPYNLTLANTSGVSAGVTFTDSLTLASGGRLTNTTQDSRVIFADNGTYTIPNITITGAAAHNILLQKGTGAHGHWHFVVAGTPSVSYATPSNSDATGSGAAITGGTDGGNNTNWDFGVAVPNAPTIGAPTVQSATSIRWKFADNSSNETGFKVYDGSNALKATCVGVNFTYCDETGLSVNTLYNDRYVVAYNANGNSTNSGTAAAIYTLADTPVAPTVNQIYGQPTQLQLIVGVNTNPASTQFAIRETQQSEPDKYVQADGSLNTDAVWQTFAQWGSSTGTTITGLTAGTQYTFDVKARNGDNTETAFGTPGAQQTTAGAGNTISGSLYDGIGGAKISAAKTIHVSVNGNAASTTETSSGDYTVTANEPLDANDIITIFVSGETEKASTVTKVSASGGLTGIDLFQNYTTIRHEGTISAITNNDLATADIHASDSDSLFSGVIDMHSGTASITFDQGLYTYTSKVYAPGGDVKVAGSWLNAGTFTCGTYTVTFNGTATGKTINPGSSSFYNLTFNGSGGAWSPLTNTVTVTNDLTMTAGTFDTSNGTANVTVNGNVACGVTCGTINMTATNTFTQNVAANKAFGTSVAGTTAWTFYNLTFTKSAGTPTITTSTTGTGDITINGVLNIAFPTTFDAGNRTYHLMGSGTPFLVNSIGSVDYGFLTANTSTFSYEGISGTIVIASATYYNLQTNPASGTVTYTLGTTYEGGYAAPCFLAGTQIMVNENQTKNIETLQAGDAVLSYDMNAHQIAPSHVTKAINTTADYYYLINGKVKATANHVFILADYSQKAVANLQVGDVLTTYNGSETIETIERIDQPTAVYDIEVEGYHLFYANGYLVHNDTVVNPVTVNNNFTLTGAGTGTVNMDTIDPDLTVNGNVSIGSGQTLIASATAAFNVGGNWLNSGTFTPGTGTVTFTKATGSQTLNSGGTAAANTFNNVTHSGANTLQLLTNNINIDGNFTNSAGIFDTNSLDMTVAGSWNGTGGAFTQGARTVTFDGTATGRTINPGATGQFYNLIFNGSGGVWSPLTNTVTVTNDLTMTAGTFDTSNGTADVSVWGNVVGTAGIINMTTANTFSQYLRGGRTSCNSRNFGTTSGASDWTFNNLTFDNSCSAGSATITTSTGGTGKIVAGGTLTITGGPIATTVTNSANNRIFDVNGDVYITSTLIASASAAFTVAGNWTNSGTFTANSGTVTFDKGSTTQTLNSGGIGTGKIFNNVTHSGAGTLQLTSTALNVDGVFTNSTGTFDANGLNMTVADDFLGAGGTFSAGVTPGTQTVTFDGTAEATVSGSTTFNNLTMDSSAGAKTIKFTAGTTQTIASGKTWTLDGAVGNVLTLRSTSDTNAWTFNISAPFTSGDYIDVMDSYSANANKITPGANVTNSGNNTGWLFNEAPNAPTLLGPAGYVDGAWQTDNTSTLTFNITDPDGADQVKYEIIISTNADLSSPTVDYTSDLGAQGERSYTASPALSDGLYYWEVKTIDTSNATSSYSVAGNSSTADIKVDTTVPTTDIHLSPADPNGTNSYYKTTAPTVTFTADDGSGSGASTIYYRWGTSGDFSAYSTGIQAPEGTNTIYYYGTDLVGNSGVASPFSREIKTDTVTPTVTATANPVGPNGSNNYYTGTAPTITLSSTDATSGLLNIQYKWDSGSYATYTTPLTAASGTHTLSYYATDNAGNTGVGSAGSTVYNVDTGIPTVSVVADPVAPNGTNGYYITTAPTVTLSSLDTGGSGVAFIQYKWDSGSYATYATPLTAASGTHTLHYYSIDTAGNSSAEASEIFKTDLVNPTVDIYANPTNPNGENGYYKTAPQITFTGLDTNSGLENIYYHWDSNGDSTYTTGFNAPEGHHIIHYYAKDNAGNQTASITRDYYVDTNTPTVSVVTNPVSPNGSNSYFIGSSPIITLTGDDSSGSGIASIKYRWGVSGGYSNYSGSITAPENINTLYYYATDNAGNSGSGSPSSMTIKLDTVLPTTDIYLNPTLPDGNNDFYTAAPEITFISTDGAGGSGAGNIYYRWGAIGDFSVYSSELTAPEGTNTIYYYGTDLAGNSGAGSPFSREIKVDSISPTVSLANSDEPNTDIGWYKDMTPDITLSADDPGGSGISAIKYRWGTTDDYTDYSSPVTAPEGVNTLYYYAINNAGNSSNVNSSTYQVDSTAPDMSNITPVTTTPTNNLSPTFTWDEASDGGGSGIDHYLVTLGSTSGDNDIASNVSTPANSFSYTFTTVGVYYIRIKAVDRVGHTSGDSNEGSVIIDQTSPSLVISNLIDGQYINTSEFTISGLASKDLVGLTGVFLQFDGGAWVNATSANNFNDWSYLWQNYTDGTHTILVKATDNAGNTITSSQYIVIVDTAAPEKPETLRAFDVSDRIAGINQSFLNWQPSTDATSGLKEYQIFRDGSQIAVTADNYFVDEKLSPQSYTYKVNAVDMAGLSTMSDEAKVELAAKGAYATNISDVKADPSKIVSQNDKTTALITWKTSGTATTLVNYGLGGAKANKTTVDNKLNMGHTVVLPDLKPNTTYHFSVVSKDIYGNQVESGDQTFTTAAAPVKETIWDVILKTVQRSFEWFRKAMASPVLEKLSLIRSPEQVGLNEMVFDVSIPEIQKYQSFIVVSGRTGMTLTRSTDGNGFNQLATTDKNYYFDQNLSKDQTYYYKVEGIEGVISLRPGSADPSAAVISDIKSKDLVVTKDNAEVMISWNTDKLTTSELDINGKVQKGDFQNQSHAMVVTGLKPGQTYHYKIKATTSEGVATENPDRTLATASAPVKETIWQTILKTLQNSLSQFSNWMQR